MKKWSFYSAPALACFGAGILAQPQEEVTLLGSGSSRSATPPVAETPVASTADAMTPAPQSSTQWATLSPAAQAAAAVPGAALPPGTGAFAPACTDGEVYDDGSAENGLGWGFPTPSVTVVSQFTPPSYPYQYDQVCMTWTQTGGDTDINFNIVIYDDDGGGGAPGTLLGAIPASATGIPPFPAVSGFFDYDVSVPIVESGSLWIGASWNGTTDANFFVGADTGSDHPDYHSLDGVNWSLNFSGAQSLQVRAAGSADFPCADGEIYDDGIPETAHGGSFDTQIFNRFTPTSYPFRYDEICVGWAINDQALDDTVDYEIHVYDDDGSSGGPGTLLATASHTATGLPHFFNDSPNYAFHTSVLDCAPLVTSGSVWIGVSWAGVADEGNYVAFDLNNVHDYYYSFDGGTTLDLNVQGLGAFMIRGSDQGGGAETSANVDFFNSGANPVSYTATAPVLGGTFTGTVDLSTTGHNLALVLGYATPLSFTLSGGQVLLINIADPMGELFAFSPQFGPTANFSQSVPAAIEFCGFTLSTQAMHVGGVMPFALSNAQNLTVGF